MDVEDLKIRLAEQDAKLDQVLRLNTTAVREIQLSKMKSSLRWLVPGIIFELLMTIVAVVWLGDFNWVLIPVTMGVAMVALVSTGTPLARPLLANPPLAFVGRISSSVYLYHLPLLLLWNKFAPGNLGWLSLPLYLAITFAVAWLSWRFVEVRYLDLRGGKPVEHG